MASLAHLAAAAGLTYGSDSEVAIQRAPAAYAALFVEQCRLFAANLPWSRLAPTVDSPDTVDPDPNIAFARQHGMELTGAHFLWHQRVPAWFADLGSRGTAEQAIIRHVTTLATHYRGQVFSWNVVNEALNPREGQTGGLRRSPLVAQLGADFFEPAFHAARQADPGALLIYNDYGMEMATADSAARRKALLALVDRLLSRSVPIDGVGLQSHLRLDGSRFDARAFRGFLDEIAARKLKILITELDVLDLQPGAIPFRDAAVASMYSAFLQSALDERAVKAVVTWGVSDRYTWLNSENDPHFRRPDDLPARPLPFDDTFLPKQAFFAIVDALKTAPRRPDA